MTFVLIALHALFWIMGGLLVAMVGYLLLLTVLAWLAPTPLAQSTGASGHRCVFLIPAHNEEKLLPRLLESLHQLAYPKTLYAVHVVADNCTDQTAVVARRGGATVHERTDATLRGKGYALQWLLQRLWDGDEPFDAAIIVDADSVVSPNFLAIMDEHLAAGERVVQAYYAVLDPGRGWNVSLRYAALAVLHYVRPLARTVLGTSAGLKGNGMLFHRTVLQRHGWSASVTEDIEYHMSLLLAGECVAFAPTATVWADMPASLRGAHTQNVRWESGRLQMLRRYVPQLVHHALRRKTRLRGASARVLLDAAMEHIIPPFSVLAGLSVCYSLAALLLGSTAGLLVAAWVIGGQIVYLLSGLMMTRAPRDVYWGLLYAPLFLLWKLWLYLRILLGRERQGWVRTARDGV